MVSGYSMVVAETRQWLVMMRQWHLFDAKWQDLDQMGKLVADHLLGRHKPIYDRFADCGDHVIVYNCRRVAMKAFDWKHREYYFDNKYPRGRALIPAWKIHENDPCRVVFMEIQAALPKGVIRRRCVERLHLLPNDKIPESLLKNVSNQIEQPRTVPRALDEYSADELAAFPKLVHVSTTQDQLSTVYDQDTRRLYLPPTPTI